MEMLNHDCNLNDLIHSKGQKKMFKFRVIWLKEMLTFKSSNPKLGWDPSRFGLDHPGLLKLDWPVEGIGPRCPFSKKTNELCGDNCPQTLFPPPSPRFQLPCPNPRLNSLSQSSMEDPGPNEDDHDHFFDAFDEFLFYDSSDAFEPEPSVSQSTISQLESNISQTTPSLRRRSSAHHRRRMSGTDSKATLSTSEITQIQDGKTTISRERKYKLHRNFEENEKDCEKTESSRVRASPVQNTEDSHAASSTGKNVQVDDSSSSNPLVFLAELVIKAIGFQINLFISAFTFPAWLLYKFCVFAIDPFQGMRHGRDYLMGKVLRLWNIAYGSVNPFISEWLKEHKSMWKLLSRFGWSLLLSVYVASILCGLLVAAFVVSGFVMRYLVEEPIRMEEALNFDYTKNSPVAFVPIKSCPSSACVNCYDKIEVGKKRGLHVIPPNHKLQVTVMLTLPESEYNRNLGVFQVCLWFIKD